jgi:hypothetical protein
MSSFRVGDSIEHNRFGVGKVLEISGEVPDIKAKVSFESYGEKILLLKYAKITPSSLAEIKSFCIFAIEVFHSLSLG